MVCSAGALLLTAASPSTVWMYHSLTFPQVGHLACFPLDCKEQSCCGNGLCTGVSVNVSFHSCAQTPRTVGAGSYVCHMCVLGDRLPVFWNGCVVFHPHQQCLSGPPSHIVTSKWPVADCFCSDRYRGISLSGLSCISQGWTGLNMFLQLLCCLCSLFGLLPIF